MTDQNTDLPWISTPGPDGDGVILHLPEITYLDTQAWAVDIGLTPAGLAALRDLLHADDDTARQATAQPAAEDEEQCGQWGGCILTAGHAGPHRHTPRATPAVGRQDAEPAPWFAEGRHGPTPEEMASLVTGQQDADDTAQCWRSDPHPPHTWTWRPEDGGADCPGLRLGTRTVLVAPAPAVGQQDDAQPTTDETQARERIENLWDRATPVGPLLDAYRAAILNSAADALEAEAAHIRYGSATDYASQHAARLRRLATGAES